MPPRPSRPPTTPTLSRLPMSSPFPIPSAPSAAAVGLSNVTGALLLLGWPISVVLVAGDLLMCCGDDLGPWGEKAAEKGVETGGVAAAPCCVPDGVLPCCEGPCFIGVGVAISAGWWMWRRGVRVRRAARFRGELPGERHVSPPGYPNVVRPDDTAALASGSLSWSSVEACSFAIDPRRLAIGRYFDRIGRLQLRPGPPKMILY